MLVVSVVLEVVALAGVWGCWLAVARLRAEMMDISVAIAKVGAGMVLLRKDLAIATAQIGVMGSRRGPVK